MAGGWPSWSGHWRFSGLLPEGWSGTAGCDPAFGAALREGETPTQAVVRLGLALDGEVLAIQGPPGSGKTTAAGELIRALLDAGKTVGVTGTSHAVIGNLLKAVKRPGMQKCKDDEHCGSADVAWSGRSFRHSLRFQRVRPELSPSAVELPESFQPSS